MDDKARFAGGAVLLLITCLIALLPGEVSASDAEKRLFEKLFNPANYNPKVRPVKNFSDIVQVRFDIHLQQIVDLDEKNQLLTTSMYMEWRWEDEYMEWDPADYEGITRIMVPAKMMWTPDILVYNSAVDSFDQLLRTNLVVLHNTSVDWLPPGLFKTTCDVDIRYFPFDDQKCKIKFGTWTFNGAMVNLTEGSKDVTGEYTKSGEWKLIGVTRKRTEAIYGCCDYPFIDMTYTIHIRRRTLFYGFHLILPCILVNALAVLVFFLPADSGERITLGITVLLALVVFLQIVADNLPPTDVIPLLGNYFACSIVMVTGTVIVTVISLNFHHTDANNANGMSKQVRWIFLYFLPKVLHMRRPGEISHKRKFIDGQPSGNPADDLELPLMPVNNDWANANLKQHQGHQQKTGAQQEMEAVLKELTFITDRIHNDDEDEKSALEWQFAATVLDTFSLWFFVLYFVITTLFTIGMAPGILLPSLDELDG